MLKAMRLFALLIIMSGVYYIYIQGIFEAPIKESHYSITTSEGKPSIYLTRTISSPSDYTKLVQYINSHKDVKEMNVYLSGNGGSVNSLLLLVNTMRHSPTKFIGIVNGKVSSAHAVLAMNMDKLIVTNENILFLFHRPAYLENGEYVLLSKICESIPVWKKDRSRSARDKCSSYITKYERSANKVAMDKTFKAMSEKQLKRYMKGWDIVLPYKEILHNMGTTK